MIPARRPGATLGCWLCIVLAACGDQAVDTITTCPRDARDRVPVRIVDSVVLMEPQRACDALRFALPAARAFVDSAALDLDSIAVWQLDYAQIGLGSSPAPTGPLISLYRFELFRRGSPARLEVFVDRSSKDVRVTVPDGNR